MQDGFLTGAVILDLCRATAGPFGGQILADLGAEVIKVETPAGGPNVREPLDEPAYQIAGMDPFFMGVNRNKKSIVVDLRRPEGLELFYQLAGKANVVYDNFRPGVMEALKIDYETLKAVNPGIISCSISGYGSQGPMARRAGFDNTLLAQSGMLALINKRDGEGRLANPRVNIADLLGGMYAACALAAAIARQQRTGEGCRIEVGMYDALISWFHGLALYPLNFGVQRDVREKLLFGVFKTKDNDLMIAGHRAGPFKKLCRALGKEEWLDDERFNSSSARVENQKLLWSLVEDELGKRGAAEWLEILEEAGVPYAEICEMGDVITGPQAQARDMVVTAEHPSYGEVKLLGNPIKVEGLEQRMAAPPLPGEHTEETLAQLLGYSKETIADLRARGIVA